MTALILWLATILLDSSHCARWQATPRGPACADIRLDAPWCGVSDWHRVGRQQIHVRTRDCGADGPVS